MDESAHHTNEVRELTSRFELLGCPDASEWAQSEVNENLPQLARFLLLRTLWSERIDGWRQPPLKWVEKHRSKDDAIGRMLAAGVDPTDIGQLAASVAYDVVFGVLYKLDEGYDPESPPGSPGWALIEVGPDGELSGRGLGGLHESILSLDPSGQEGKDLL